MGDGLGPAPHLAVDAEGERQPHGVPIIREEVKTVGNLIVFLSDFFLKDIKMIEIILTSLLHSFLTHACIISNGISRFVLNF